MPFATADAFRSPMRAAPATCANEAGAIEKEWAMHK
jgi:hypothetical protein